MKKRRAISITALLTLHAFCVAQLGIAAPERYHLRGGNSFVDSFYGVARQREDAFVANSLKAMDNRLPVSPLTGEKGAFKPQDPSAPKAAVLKEVYTPMSKPAASAAQPEKPVLPGLEEKK